jgi:hypothetical protein
MLELVDARKRNEQAKKYLRLFMRDTPAFNRLIRREESDDDLMQFAIDMAVSDWNSTAPFVGSVTIANYPSLFLLMHGAAIQLLKTQGLLQARNELNYSAGGSSFMRSNKSNYYMAWMTNFANEYQTSKRNMKIAQNISHGWGGVASEYGQIGYAWIFVGLFIGINFLQGASSFL